MCTFVKEYFADFSWEAISDLPWEDYQDEVATWELMCDVRDYLTMAAKPLTFCIGEVM